MLHFWICWSHYADVHLESKFCLVAEKLFGCSFKVILCGKEESAIIEGIESSILVCWHVIIKEVSEFEVVLHAHVLLKSCDCSLHDKNNEKRGNIIFLCTLVL